MKALVWDETSEKGERFDVIDIPAEYEAQAEEWRAKLLDIVATEDEVLMEKYLGDEELTEDDIKRGHPRRHAGVQLRAGALRLGVQEQGRAAACSTPWSTTCPSPLDIPPAEGTDLKGDEVVERKADEGAPFAALAFKIVADPYRQAHLLPGLLGHASTRATRSTTPPRTARSGSAASC